MTVNSMYYWSLKPEKLRTANGRRFYIYVEGRAPNLRSDISETKKRAKETEDETRKRLGLSPYGKHNDEEWMLALIKKVEKRLIDEGYDPKVEFQRRLS